MGQIIIFLILSLALMSYFFGKKRAVYIQVQTRLTALPQFYGYYLAIWCAAPALIIFSLWTFFEPFLVKNLILSSFKGSYESNQLSILYAQIKSIAQGTFFGTAQENLVIAADKYNQLISLLVKSKAILSLIILIGCLSFAYKKINQNIRTREPVEKFLKYFFFSCSLAAVLTTAGIVFSLLFESLRFFSSVNFFDFAFGIEWNPGRAFVRDSTSQIDQEVLKNSFGALPLFAGTFFIAFIAMCVAIPIGLMTGIYMAEYAGTNVRKFAKPIIEILAGIPTVVYGFFAALTVGPFVKQIGNSMGLEVSSESALAAGLVMGVMIIPFVSSLSDDVITAVPQNLREGSYAMGATKSETIKKVIFPAALPGIVGAILLAVSRAVGETMIVVMASGLAANLTVNPLESTTTITAQIVMILVGDQQFGDPKTQAAFALGISLFVLTLILNVIALGVVKKYREKYE